MKAAARLLLILALVAPTFASAQVQPTTPPTCKLFASATTVKANTKVKLDWTTTNASSGYLTEVGTIAPNGSAFVVPGKNTTYAASFTGPGGSIVCRVAIAVSAGSSGGGQGGGVPIDTNNPVDTKNPVNTNAPINTNVPVDLSGRANLGGSVPLPTVPSVAPGLTAPSGGGFMGGIVPQECRGKSTIANCDLCSLAQLGQNIANFLLGLTIPAAALLFAWAGILYFSSRGNPVQIGHAHKIFKTVVISLVIALSAWVLVITVMGMLVHGGDLKSWRWDTLNCAETRKARLHNMSLNDYLSSSLPGLTAYKPPPPAGAGKSGRCDTGYVYSPAIDQCYNPDNPEDYKEPKPTPVPSQTGVGDCSPEAMAQDWEGSSAAAMSCIVQKESSCDAGRPSRSDRGADQLPFSSGLYQININANYMQCDEYAGGQKVDCPSAFEGRNYKGRVVNQDLYNQCIAMANNRDCATQSAQRILNNQGYKAWSTAAACGL